MLCSDEDGNADLEEGEGMASDVTSLDEDDVSDEDFEMSDDQIEEEEEDADRDNQQKLSHPSRKKEDKPDPRDEHGIATINRLFSAGKQKTCASSYSQNRRTYSWDP